MKNVLLALGLSLAATSGAFAGTSALDATHLPQDIVASNPAAPIARTSGENRLTQDGPFSDHSPVYLPASAQIDYTATASVNDGQPRLSQQPRLGDGGILPY
ncbi:MAG: hypothetical protein CML29_14265 [Rhizobiales bacterium]|nr:hypothetical protein [Hyphomicrobiales bacterium]MBA69237.1 hypothetical protein [Hyphomicrobiales bacterium]